MSMSTRARGEGDGFYDCWVQELGVAIYGCFTYLINNIYKCLYNYKICIINMLRGMVPQNTFLLIPSLIFNGFSI